MADRSTCLANAKMLDPNAVLCDEWMCQTDKATQVYAFCHCKAPYPPQNPCPYSGNSPVATYDKQGNVCWCCCSCFAWHTPIAVPAGEPKPIQTFVIGDPVLAAGTDLKWVPYAVQFSQGIPPGEEYGKTMFSVYFELAGSVTSLVVTADHVFLLADGSLKRTEHLVPGTDQLMSAEGEAVHLLAMETGGWFGGIHHIATGEAIATEIKGHLLNSKGIVTGDWALQMADFEGGAVHGAHASATEGKVLAATQAYVEKHDHLEGDIFAHAVPGAQWAHARHAEFRPYTSGMSQVPEHAMRFVTEKQAENIYANSVQAPVSSNRGQDACAYLFRLFQGFYPDVNFRLEWGAILPNAYSWMTYGVPFVVVNGGLVRTDGVDLNTLTVILAHELGHLYGGPPLSGDGEYSCEGQADYSATAGVLRGVLTAVNYPTVAPPGVDGVARLFDLIDPKNRKGVPGQTCDGLSTDCRLEAFRAGLYMDLLPPCAGGPEITYLTLSSAVAGPLTTPEDPVAVELTFDMPLDLPSASHRQNYVFNPEAEVVSALPVKSNPDAVTVNARLIPGEAYQVAVRNVIAADKSTLENNVGTAEVTWSKDDA
ncbi:MAG: hypothetical protein JO013_10015 [Alphaproteobacteria bacterium]|nr:hypothetical protein [Alphaproteobacteria bacterium]